MGCIIASIVGLFSATLIAPNVWIEGTTWQFVKTLVFAGIVLGLINFFIKPVIKAVTFPLRFITLGLFGLVINMALIWVVDVIFTPELTIKGLVSLFWTGILVWGTNLIFARKRLGLKRPEFNED